MLLVGYFVFVVCCILYNRPGLYQHKNDIKSSIKCRVLICGMTCDGHAVGKTYPFQFMTLIEIKVCV
jgi:hypothetical protein